MNTDHQTPVTNHQSPLAVLILAAGKGTRMKSSMPKVLHPMAGMPMLGHVLTAAKSLNPTRTIVITGYGADDVEAYATKTFPGTEYARQTEQLGTAHAIQQAEPLLQGFTGTVVILYADIMLGTRPDVLPTLMEQHSSNTNGLTILTANTSNPSGLGRIFMKRNVVVNVEDKDCTVQERGITTVNPAIHAVPAPLLFKLLSQVKNDNAQKEYYLPDIIALAHSNGAPVITAEVPSERSELGMNSRAEIAEMETLWQTRKRTAMMASGVTLLDPTTVYFAPDTQIAPDTTIHQNVVFGPGVKIESNVNILPFCHIAGSIIRQGAEIGPFARLRSGTDVGEKVELGSFVVTKKAKIGKKSKAKQLNCLVDCTIGEGVNVGAGAMIANYHHFTKQKQETIVEDGASLGSNSVLVAPAHIGKDAFVAAGTVVRGELESGSLIVSQPPQKTKANYAKK